MNNASKFSLCQRLAAAIVGKYRDEAPAGCDPQNTYVAIAGTVISVGVGAYQAHQQAKAAKQATAGEVPEAATYDPINFSKQQSKVIAGNFKNVGAVAGLDQAQNNILKHEDIARARKFIPGIGAFLRQESQNTGSLLKGNLPYDDVLDIASNRNGLSNALGTPGTGSPATLRDLGLSRLSAMKEGQGMLASMVSNAEALSPISRYARPQDSMLNPSQVIPLELEQRQLEQQSEQNANNLAAGVSPTSLARQANAMSGASSPAGNYASGIGQIAAAFARNQQNGGAGAGGDGSPGPGAFSPGTTGGYASDIGAIQAAPNAAAYSYDPTIGYSPVPYSVAA